MDPLLNITLVVDESLSSIIADPKRTFIPYDALYADDVMVFWV
ncbi:hypothetical protein L195_g062990, partial [Trifolium pratense]